MASNRGGVGVMLQRIEEDPATWKEKVEKYIVNGSTTQKWRKAHVKNFLLPSLETLEVVEAERISDSQARIVFRFPILEEYLNPQGSLHGGAAAAFLDSMTTWCLLLVAKRPNYWVSMGTTRTLALTYVRSAKVGEIALVDAEIVSIGKRLVLLRGTMKRESDGAILVACEHNKYNVDADIKL